LFGQDSDTNPLIWLQESPRKGLKDIATVNYHNNEGSTCLLVSICTNAHTQTAKSTCQPSIIDSSINRELSAGSGITHEILTLLILPLSFILGEKSGFRHQKVQCSKYPRYNPDIAPILRLRHLAAMIWHIQTDIAFFIQNRR